MAVEEAARVLRDPDQAAVEGAASAQPAHARHLRHDAGESQRTAGIPVVAVTAQAMKQDRERVLQAGFNGYVEKPISVRAFPDQVRRFLSGEEVGTE